MKREKYRNIPHTLMLRKHDPDGDVHSCKDMERLQKIFHQVTV